MTIFSVYYYVNNITGEWYMYTYLHEFRPIRTVCHTNFKK